MVAEEESSFFAKLTNEVLRASEQVTNTLEDGISLLLKGELSQQASSNNANNDNAHGGTFGGNDNMENPMIDDELFDDEDPMMGSPLEGIANSVLGDIMSKQVGPQTPMEHLQAFKSAVRWSEPFVVSLLAFQVVMFLLCVWIARPNRGTAVRIAFMVTIGIIVRSSEYLNRLGAERWESFATQDYFDKQGVFVLTFLSGPLLLDCIFLLMMFVREASQLLVQVKRNELERKKKKQQATTTTKRQKRDNTDENKKSKKRSPKKED